MERELYIIRHGQTDHNAKGIIQGRGVDLSLNDTGRKQAQAFYEVYKDVPFDVLYSSSLKRAQETIAPFKSKNIEHIIDADLDEISWGDLEGSAVTRESDESFKNLVGRWREGHVADKPSPTGESPLDVQERQQAFLKRLLASPYKKALIATHGRFIRIFMCTLTGRPLSEMESFPHSNLCLYKVRQKEDGLFEVELHFDTDHLSSV